MTPQLQQAIRLLQLPIMDLQTQIQEALEENVMLEVDEAASSEATEDATERVEEPNEPDLNDADWTDIQRTGPSDTPTTFEPRGQREYADLSEDTLKDHLLWQLELESLDPRTTAIGQAIVDGINEDGSGSGRRRRKICQRVCLTAITTARSGHAGTRVGKDDGTGTSGAGR